MALRCLIVDDNADFLAAARSLLAREGMVVGVASSSAEALARAEEFHPDVILVDIELGQESSLDLARQLPAAPAAQHSCVILCSAHPAQDFADLIAKLEADARQEADLVAELARLLLRTQDLRLALPEVAQRLAQTLELPHAVIELDTVAGDEHQATLPLHDGATQLGTLLVPADLAEPVQRRLRERIVPSLEALLHAAWERQAIGRALETSRDEQRLLAEQQAALRRVATLVAQGVSPTQLFTAVAEQMGQILHAEFTEIIRHGTDRTFTVAGSWTPGNPKLARPIDSRWPLEPGTIAPLLLRTGRPARICFERDDDSDGVIHRWVREQGITGAVGCPIVVEGRQWGAMYAHSTKAEPQPADTEERMQEFTELVATAIANTESRAQLIASRARVVAAADQTRRRIERDLHDGTQQRLISLALDLRAAEAATPPELDNLRAHLAHTAQGLADAVTELQEISRGIHPPILSSGGLAPALETLARRSAVPVELTVSANQRLAEPVEVAAYYIVSEALTNATKHAHASVVHVNLDAEDAILRLSVCDDGVGGADPGQGSGLTGLRDRVEALCGTMEIASPTGGGTSLTVEIPIHNDLPAAHRPAGARHLTEIGRAALHESALFWLVRVGGQGRGRTVDVPLFSSWSVRTRCP